MSVLYVGFGGGGGSWWFLRGYDNFGEFMVVLKVYWELF